MKRNEKPERNCRMCAAFKVSPTGHLKHLGVRCLLLDARVHQSEATIHLAATSGETKHNRTQMIKAGHIQASPCFYHSPKTTGHIATQQSRFHPAMFHPEHSSEVSPQPYSGFWDWTPCWPSLDRTPHAIISVSLFLPLIEAKATMVCSPKCCCSFCPYFHSLCPCWSVVLFGIWEIFVFANERRPWSGCNVHEN